MRIGVLASHQGTILQALIDSNKVHPHALEIPLVISNNSNAGARERAKFHAIPFLHLSKSTCATPEKIDIDMRDALLAHEIDIVFLAGYLRMLGPKTRAAFPSRILNTHPALLPQYGGKGMYGNNVHEAVLAAGETVTGITIHLVDSEYDTGQIICQCQLSVKSDDTVKTLSFRSAERERAFVVETLLKISFGKIKIPEIAATQ